MNLKQLRYFREIAKEGQITRAAKKLHIAQPPLSQSLKTLEENLGVTLFERNGRKMELTEAGEVLYEKTSDIFYQLDEAVKVVKETGEGVRGTLAIGCNKSCFPHLPGKMQTFHQMYPNVTYKLLEGDSYFLIKQLIQREIELAIVRLPIEMDGLASFPLPDETYVAVISATWLNGNRDYISLEELASIPLLLLHRIKGVGQFEIITDTFKEKGLTPHILCESPDVDMLLGLVEKGLGATIVPKSTLSTNLPEHVKILPVEQTEIISKSAIVWLEKRYLSKSATQFMKLFEREE